MSIQILGGHARGHALFVPKGTLIRPTSVMLRRKFFDAHQNFDGIFIDLCAGSGAMGLEALSRGAKLVHLNEFQVKVFQVLKKNTKAFEKYQLGDLISTKADASKALVSLFSTYRDNEEAFFFFDPPYEDHKLYHMFLKTFSCSHACQLWIESDRQKGLKLEQIEEQGFEVLKLYKQGTSFITRVQFSGT